MRVDSLEVSCEVLETKTVYKLKVNLQTNKSRD